jgi:hypothetical protein
LKQEATKNQQNQADEREFYMGLKNQQKSKTKINDSEATLL